MINLLGINISENKTILSFLLKIYGIGKTTAKIICDKININFNKKLNKFNSTDFKLLNNEIKKYKIENELKIIKNNHIKNLINIKSYRGMRHRRSLPCRGQRTRTNAKTCKKFKKLWKK